MPGIFQKFLIYMYACVKFVAASCEDVAKGATHKDQRLFNGIYKEALLPLIPSPNAGMSCSKVPDDTDAGCGARSASMAGCFKAVVETIRPRTRLSADCVRDGIGRNKFHLRRRNVSPTMTVAPETDSRLFLV